jgi:hypothetical protein
MDFTVARPPPGDSTMDIIVVSLTQSRMQQGTGPAAIQIVKADR